MALDLPKVNKVAVREHELSAGACSLEQLDGYDWVSVFVRLHGAPVGYVTSAVERGRVDATQLRQLIADRLGADLARLVVTQVLLRSTPSAATLHDALRVCAPAWHGPWPKLTVAVCTRDRPHDLARCIPALLQLDYPDLDIVIVDNAPSSDASARVAAEFRGVRYVREPRPGLDWARNRAIAEARGEIVAYTDDDVVVDKRWASSLAAVFAEHPEVMAVTGLVTPLQLETSAQIQFELNGGFGRGPQRRWFGINLPAGELAATRYAGTGRFGTGANMAFRKSVFERVGMFDPALDVGTVTNGGGDLEMFFRVLKGGFFLVYEPAAIIRHRHREGIPALLTQIAANGIGYYAYLSRCAHHFPEERLALVRNGLWWLGYWSGRRLVVSTLRRRPLERQLAAGELAGSFTGMRAYEAARERARALAGSEPLPDRLTQLRMPETRDPHAVAVRRCELMELGPIEDVQEYATTRVYVFCRDLIIGHVDIENLYARISRARLSDVIAEALWPAILERATGLTRNAAVAELTAALQGGTQRTSEARVADEPFDILNPTVCVSIVLPTWDRPDDLRRCLQSLSKIRTSRAVQIIVVDNNPTSGVTAPVARALPSVTLVEETRRGVSYASNEVIREASGEIIVCIDDDVVVEPDWLERLLAPFARPDVQCVTGNVLPLSLEARSQRFFERHGGLSRGYQRREVDGTWFQSFADAVPTWTLGGTTNLALRADLLRDPQLRLPHEGFGRGEPSLGEDTYTFYRVLKQGHTLIYEPSALVWRRQSDSMPPLRRLLVRDGAGHVAYQLRTLVQDGDLRAVRHLFGSLPTWRAKQITRGLLEQLRGNSDYPVSLMLLELGGNLLGPAQLARTYWQTQRSVRSSAL